MLNQAEGSEGTLTFVQTADADLVVQRTQHLDLIRLWLDDDLSDRAAPAGWVHVTTVQQAVALLYTGKVVELSLDNDLGDDEQHGTGIQVIDHICASQQTGGVSLWPREGLHLHTANPYARDAMTRAIKRYAGSQLANVRDHGAQRSFVFTSCD